jgi:hypothetical protein
MDQPDTAVEPLCRLSKMLCLLTKNRRPCQRRSQEAQPEPFRHGRGVQPGEPAFVPLCGE